MMETNKDQMIQRQNFPMEILLGQNSTESEDHINDICDFSCNKSRQMHADADWVNSEPESSKEG